MYNASMIKDEQLQGIIASNIVYYRKQLELTQSQLAEKINYSDKAISKWERGEGVPDIFILKQLADLFHVTVNDLLSEKKKKKAPSFKRNKVIITLLSVLCVWLVAVTLFAIIQMTPVKDLFPTWLIFIYALPITFIVTQVFTCLWYPKFLKFLSITFLIWTTCLTLSLTLFCAHVPNWYGFFLIGIPLQIAFILWFFFKKKKKDVSIQTEEVDEQQ